MNSKKIALLLTGCAFAISACSTANKNLDTKLSQETTVKNRTDLQKEAADLIEKSPSLTAAQKTSLVALREDTRRQMDQIQKDSLKLRAVLIQDVLSKNYNAQEVAQIKKRMSALDSKRMTVIFDTVDKANTILGRDKMIEQKDFIMMDMFPHDTQRGEF